MIVIAKGVGHRVDSTLADHYSLLRTVEENFGLPLLGNAGAPGRAGSGRGCP